MKNMTLGKYVPYNSIIHRLDPRIKLFAMTCLFVIIFLPKLSLESYLLLIALIFVLVKISSLKIRNLLRTLKVMWLMFFILLLINIFSRREGSVILNINNFRIYDMAIIFTLEIVVRMFLLLSISTLLSATTKPLELTYAIEWYMMPLKKIKVPVHEFAMIIAIALRFIPTILEDAQRIMKAQASRGVDLVNGNLKEKIKGIIALIVPLLSSSIERADELAFAMDARGYDSRAKRTRYRLYKFHLADLVVFLSFIGLIVFFVYFKKYNLIPIADMKNGIEDFFRRVF